MRDTPTPRVGEQIVYLLDDTMNEVEAVPAEFARQLERELAELKDKFDGGQMAHAATLADLRDCKEQLAETSRDFRCLAELLDGHDATECRANLVKLKADLAAERALADRLAASLDISQEHHAEGTKMPYDEAHTAERALEAWKEARK